MKPGDLIIPNPDTWRWPGPTAADPSYDYNCTDTRFYVRAEDIGIVVARFDAKVFSYKDDIEEFAIVYFPAWEEMARVKPCMFKVIC